MKVISLLQPYATLVVIGAKKIETRSWNTKFRGEILIHASKKWTKDQEKLLEDFYFGTALQDECGKIHIPCGKIIGKVNIVDTFQFQEDTKDHLKTYIDDDRKISWDLTDKEKAFGDYSPNRYGWLLYDPVQFAQSIAAKGQLGIWNYDMPDRIHIPIVGGSHATFLQHPDKKTLDAVTEMIEIAKRTVKYDRF